MLPQDSALVPTHLVGVAAIGGGLLAPSLTLPEGTRIYGSDLSGTTVTLNAADAPQVASGVTRVVFPMAPQLTFPDPTAPGGVRTEKVPAREIAAAVERACVLDQVRPTLEAARRLAWEGKVDEAFDRIEDLIAAGGAIASPYLDHPVPFATAKTLQPLSAYVEAKIFPAFANSCLADTGSPDATVPDAYDWVAYSRAFAVSREAFQGFLDQIRAEAASSPAKAPDLPVTIGGLAAVLEAATSSPNRVPCLVVGETTVNLTNCVFAVGGGTGGGAWDRPFDDAFTVGFATISVDRAMLLRAGLDDEGADAAVTWLRRRVEADVAFATATAKARSLDALLRSPDALKVILTSGAVVENPHTETRVHRDQDHLVVTRDPMAPDAGPVHERRVPLDSVEADVLVRNVAADGRFRLAAGHAAALIEDAGVLGEATGAYRSDRTLVGRERAERRARKAEVAFALAVEDAPEDESGAYSLIDEVLEAARFSPESSKNGQVLGEWPSELG